jgi:hypothetical protein
MTFAPGYYCDDARHLVCVPYNVPALHAMAAALGIKRCWYHADRRHPHYDIPSSRIAEIKAKVTVVTGRDILAITKSLKPLQQNWVGSL